MATSSEGRAKPIRGPPAMSLARSARAPPAWPARSLRSPPRTIRSSIQPPPSAGWPPARGRNRCATCPRPAMSFRFAPNGRRWQTRWRHSFWRIPVSLTSVSQPVGRSRRDRRRGGPRSRVSSEKDTQDWGRGRPRPRERLATGSTFGIVGRREKGGCSSRRRSRRDRRFRVSRSRRLGRSPVTPPPAGRDARMSQTRADRLS